MYEVTILDFPVLGFGVLRSGHLTRNQIKRVMKVKKAKACSWKHELWVDGAWTTLGEGSLILGRD